MKWVKLFFAILLLSPLVLVGTGILIFLLPNLKELIRIPEFIEALKALAVLVAFSASITIGWALMEDFLRKQKETKR